jgi:Co/Zn/Cd efflux system component
MNGTPPDPLLVTGVGLAALAANLACLGLLYAHRRDDINMRSTWICSRNDIVANMSVLVSAGGVAALGSIWPDVVVSLGIVALFLWSAAGVLRAAKRELQRGREAFVGLCRNGLCASNACRC